VHEVRAHGFDAGERVMTRLDLFSLAAAELHERRVLYLEFGVYEGESMRTWSRLLRNPAASLHGFDSFTGLRESWNEFTPAGTFSTGGRVPSFDDPRIKLFAGFFDETLPRYTPPTADQLFVNVDCDLYSSAATVLRWVEPLLAPGSYLYFDEFSDRNHELRAFSEFLDRTGMRFTLVGATRTLAQVLFQRV
jgi:hypothetical protein